MMNRIGIRWPFLHNLIEMGFLNYADYALADWMLPQPFAEDEAVAALICHLSLATAKGHLCISITDKILPSLEDTWRTKEVQTISLETLLKVSELILKGFQLLPQPLVAKVPKEPPVKPICIQNDLLYFQKYWLSEEKIYKELERIKSESSRLSPNLTCVEEKLKALALNKEQAEAVRKFCLQNFLILCGGPGTGKTFTAGHLIGIFYESLSEEEKKKCRIVLAAPTGKAAANLQASLGKATGHLKEFPLLQAKTIHALLGIKRHIKEVDPENGLAVGDVVIVDESSMIDAELMALLLSSIKPGARILLLGDRFQLPPIGVGAPFGDFCKHFSDDLIELKKCVRTDSQEIIQLATAVKEGRSQEALQLSSSSLDEVKFKQFDFDRTALKELLRYVVPFFQTDQFKLLTPLRQGIFGVDKLNEAIHARMMGQADSSGFVKMPIMITKNHSKLNLFNGDIGTLVKQQKEGALQKGDYALFPAREGILERRISALLLPEFEYAYCLSVHKSQGSEYEHLLLLLPDGSEIFGREALYTAITRAKKRLDIWTSRETFKKAVDRQAYRLSKISQ